MAEQAGAQPGAARALLALWNDVAPALDAEYNAWHAQEHVPERLTVPGMLWGHRFGRAAAPGGMPRYLTLYGLSDAGVLDGEAYQRLLREPTPTSRRMRPALANLSRWVCSLHEASGLDRGSRLGVWAVDAADAPGLRGRLPACSEARGRLAAERLPQARALPWLQSGQSQAIEGDWLLGLTTDGPGPAGATVYQRLPVG